MILDLDNLANPVQAIRDLRAAILADITDPTHRLIVAQAFRSCADAVDEALAPADDGDQQHLESFHDSHR